MSGQVDHVFKCEKKFYCPMLFLLYLTVESQNGIVNVTVQAQNRKVLSYPRKLQF